ncbi:unnamed protein product [Cuscuta epithymum]|uniref:Uncharacterized protein n=1 Tax=Cuscuta epithymum TaxID=186058 RepID=A0AAV0CN40_9ASTE|nr:unnamed protein product [Cuscuta epithymum]
MNRSMNKKKKVSSSTKKNKKFADPFFESEGGDKKRRRNKFLDDDIESSDDDGVEVFEGEGGGDDAEEGNEVEESVAEKKKRLAYTYLEKIRSIAKRDEEDTLSGDENDREEIEGMRDSMVAKILQQEQLEESGRIQRAIASRIREPEPKDGFQILLKHRQAVTAVALSEDDLKGFSASKDGTIFSWDVHMNGKKEKYSWPSDEALKSHGLKEPQGRASNHSKHVLALAVSTDGRYMASGGMDRHVHLWDVRTREHIRAFPGHKGPVSCLTFRQGTSELFSGSFDRSVKIWNVEDRAYVNTLFGHQGEVLTIDSLRKERVLTVGRDRTMHLFKVPEESQFVFRASASLESGCYVNNDEFLSGSSDGSIEHWTVKKKKPIHVIKNAHPSITEQKSTGTLSNGDMGDVALNPEGSTSSALSWVGAVAVCRSSDLAASGAGNGLVRLWKLESDSRGISPLFKIPLVGFINSLAFAKSGRFLVAGVGKEPRLGRWGRIVDGQNGVAMHSFELE